MPLSGTKGNGLKPLKLFGFSVILNHECQEHEAMKMKEMWFLSSGFDGLYHKHYFCLPLLYLGLGWILAVVGKLMNQMNEYH